LIEHPAERVSASEPKFETTRILDVRADEYLRRRLGELLSADVGACRAALKTASAALTADVYAASIVASEIGRKRFRFIRDEQPTGDKRRLQHLALHSTIERVELRSQSLIAGERRSYHETISFLITQNNTSA
jgi:hypothetical protein